MISPNSFIVDKERSISVLKEGQAQELQTKPQGLRRKEKRQQLEQVQQQGQPRRGLPHALNKNWRMEQCKLQGLPLERLKPQELNEGQCWHTWR